MSDKQEQVNEQVVAVVMSKAELEMIKQAEACLKAETKLVIGTADVIREYSVAGIPAAEIATRFVERLKAVGRWPMDGERHLNTTEARTFAVGKAANTLASTCSAKRSGERLTLKDGIAVISDDGKLVWEKVEKAPKEPSSREPRQPSADDKGPLPAPKEQVAREAAQTDKARHEHAAAITVQVMHMRRKREGLRPLRGAFVEDRSGHLDQIIREIEDLAVTDGLRRAEIEDLRDKMLAGKAA